LKDLYLFFPPFFLHLKQLSPPPAWMMNRPFSSSFSFPPLPSPPPPPDATPKRIRRASPAKNSPFPLFFFSFSPRRFQHGCLASWVFSAVRPRVPVHPLFPPLFFLPHKPATKGRPGAFAGFGPCKRHRHDIRFLVFFFFFFFPPPLFSRANSKRVRPRLF